MNGPLLLPGSRPIFELVERTQRLLRLTAIGAGVCLTAGALLGTVVVAIVIDWLFPLDLLGRAVALAIVLAASITTYILTVLRPAAAPLDLSRVARRMERHLPGIRNRLVTCIELLGNAPAATRPAADLHDRGGARSLAFEQRLVSETNERIRAFEPNRVVNWRTFQQALAFVLAGIVSLGLLALLWPTRTGVTLQRLLVPLADIAPASSVVYTVAPGDAKLLRGDEFAIHAAVNQGQPDRLRVEIRPETGGAAVWYDLTVAGTNVWRFNLTGYENSFRYRVVGGGTWSQTYRVAVLDRPNITGVQMVLRYPEYLQPTPPVLSAAQVPDVTGPEGSEVEIVARVEGDVSSGTIQRLEIGTNGQPRVVGSLPLSPTNETWTGRFTLTSNGLYRVEFRNELGHANRPMTPARFVALADQPPQVAIERPGADVSLSPTGKLPLSLAASDDFGLATLVLVLAPSNTNAEQRVGIQQFATNQTTAAIWHTLDLAQFGLAVGGTLRYRAEVRDRKGQTAQTGDFFVRVTAPNQSAEQNLAKLVEQQEAGVRKLTDLVAAQDSVRIKLEGLAGRYAPLLEKLETAARDVELRPAPETAGGAEALSPTNIAIAVKLHLDAIELNQLQGLQSRLADLGQVQLLNWQQAQQFATQLRAAGEAAAALPLMPIAMSEQLRVMHRGFEQMVVQPMQTLANALQQSGSLQQLPFSLESLRAESEETQQNMAALAASLEELAATTERFADQPSEALRALQEAQLRSQARLGQRELDYLQQQLGTMTDEMKRLQGAQEQLAEQTAQVDTNELAAVARQQAALEKELTPLLQTIRDLQTQGKLRPMRRPPTFPDEPYTADNAEALLPPKEEDVAEPPVADKQTPEERAAQLRQQLQQQLDEVEDEDEPLYMPVLSDEKPKLNPRYAHKMRPGEKISQLGLPLKQPQQKLQSRQTQRLQELDLAEQSVSADQHVLDAVAEQLQRALGVRSGQEGLQQALQAPNLNRALEMAARMQQITGRSGVGHPRGLPRMGGWSMYGGGMVYLGPLPASAPLPELDVTARTLILNMQPKLREELLQGMQEQGPAPYQPYIRQYFEQLSKVKEKK